MLLASWLTDDATAWSTVVLAGVTVVLGYFGFRQVNLTRRALDQASNDNQEAIKARIDAQAPRVVIVGEARAQATKSWPSNGAEIVGLEDGEEIDWEGARIGITGWFRFVNEGKSTGIVDVPPGVAEFPFSQPIVSLNGIQRQRPDKSRQLTVEPGKGYRLFVQVEKTLSEWKAEFAKPVVERSPAAVPITTDDTFRDGIHDVTDLTLHGVPISLAESRWIASPDTPTELEVVRTVRYYPNLKVPPNRSTVIARLRAKLPRRRGRVAGDQPSR